jgi:outer membrane immunogenic protein
VAFGQPKSLKRKLISDTQFQERLEPKGEAMKKAIVAGLAFGALLGPAAAADLYVKAPPPPAPCIWCGFYIGANAGYAWSDDSVTSTGALLVNPGVVAVAGPNAAVAGLSTPIPGGNANGFIGGFQAGYNFQYSNFVYGIETDIQGLSGKSSGATSNTIGIVGFAPAVANTTLTATDSVSWLGTLRGRLGYTVTPSVLVYGTGGLAYGEAKSSTAIGQQLAGAPITGANAPYGSFTSISSTRTGWAAGGGAEWLITRNWTAKLEYLHYDLGSASYGSTMSNLSTVGAPVPIGTLLYTNAATSSTSFKGDIVRAGLNYKF